MPIATAMVGPISFLGLIIANLSRQLIENVSSFSQLIFGSVLFGMVVLAGGQLIVEHVFVYSVPVSVFITVGRRDFISSIFCLEKGGSN